MMLLHGAGAVSATALWTHWTTEPGGTIAVAATAVVYSAGVRSVWRRAGVGRGIRRWCAWAFAAGIATLLVALASPLDPLAEDLFSAHMAQHVLLAVVAPPLLVAGAPMTALVWALPSGHRSRWASVLVPARWPGWLERSAQAPGLACAAYGATLWSWHLPAAYELALRSAAVHALEHASLVGTGCWLWWTILHGRRSRRTAYGVGLIVLFVTMLHSAALGALVTLSRRVWYPAYAASAMEWGWNPLRDQQLAGLIMWVPGGLLQLAAMSVLFVAWLRATGGRRAASAGVALAALASAGCARAEGSGIPGGDVARGRDAIAASGCGSCHTIAGVSGAHGLVGPPLTGVASRSMLAGQLPNTPENMVRWISDPPSVEPGTAMPNLHLGERTVRDIVAYLYTLH